MGSEYFIRYEPLLGSGYPRATIDPSIYDLPHSFFLCEGKQRNFCKTRVMLRLSDHALKFELPAFLAEYDQARFDQAVLRWAVLRIEEEFLTDTFDGALSYIDIDVPDFEALRGLADAKSCDYQVREKRDLFCSASSDADLGKTATLGLRTLAATSIPTCINCDLPDSDYLCSSLSHPRVLRSLGGTDRRVLEAKCDFASPGIARPSLCRPGGNQCWGKIIRSGGEDQLVQYVSPALSRALDYLDAVWRLRFGVENHLVTIGNASSIAILESDCLNAAQFDVCLSALCDILRGFRVLDEFFEPQEIPRDQTLKRLKVTLEKHLKPTSMRVLTSVETLQAVNEWRNATQHTKTKANRANAEKTLGIRYYPNVTWKVAWDELRSKTVEAVNVISAEIRNSVDL